MAGLVSVTETCGQARFCARGSARVGLAGCAGGPCHTTYDLTAPREVSASGRGRGLLVVAEPQACSLRFNPASSLPTRGGGIAYLPDAQWADRLPKLLQVRLIQTFENGQRIQAIGPPG